MMLLLFIVSLVSAGVAPTCTLSNKLPNAYVSNVKYCPFVWASGLSEPRGMIVAGKDILVIERGKNRITALWDDDNDGVSNSSERAVLASAPGLNHGIEILQSKNWLFASSPTTVYRWNYAVGTRTSLGAGQAVITGIEAIGHSTRTLRFNPGGNRLFVSKGSTSNIDSNAAHALIRRFTLAQLNPASPASFDSGALFAYGLRNEVGLRFAGGSLYGVENGMDNVQRPDLTSADIHNDNPCEELNLLGGGFYGYPFCWSEGILPTGIAKGAGTQWAHQDFLGKGISDARCRNATWNKPPLHCFEAHNAPLDIIFGVLPNNNVAALTNAWISFHGSWNRVPAGGYRVRRVDFNAQKQITNVVDVLTYKGPGAAPSGGSSDVWIRPVGLAIQKCPWNNCLFISSDATGQIVGIAQKASWP